MFLIVGLGNPGLKFKKTRHNIGFMALDALQKENNFPKFKLNKKCKVEISEGNVNGKRIILAKPHTYMNNSGEAVKALGSFSAEKEPSAFLIVIHDDFDLQFGEIKTSENAASAGHHGVQSIIDHLKTQDFIRLRIGIKPISNLKPQILNLELQKLKAENFVLKNFTKEETKQLPDIIKKSVQILADTII